MMSRRVGSFLDDCTNIHSEEDLEKAIVYLQNELTHAKRQNLPGQSYDHIVLTGSGIPGGLQDNEYQLSGNAD